MKTVHKSFHLRLSPSFLQPVVRGGLTSQKLLQFLLGLLATFFSTFPILFVISIIVCKIK